MPIAEIAIIPDDRFQDGDWYRLQEKFKEANCQELPANAEMIGQVSRHRVVRLTTDHDELIYLWGNTYPIAYIRLDGQRQTATVKAIRVDPVFTGQGLARRIYEWVLENLYPILVADKEQTASGRQLWAKLLKSDEFNVYLFNEKTNKVAVAKTEMVLNKAYKPGFKLLLTLASVNLTK